jgi:hypothetical protein
MAWPTMLGLLIVLDTEESTYRANPSHDHLPKACLSHFHARADGQPCRYNCPTDASVCFVWGTSCFLPYTTVYSTAILQSAESISASSEVMTGLPGGLGPAEL